MYCTFKIWRTLQVSRIRFMNSTPAHHQRSLTHHTDSCTTLLLHVTHGQHFPSTIALIHTSVTNQSLHWLHSWTPSDTLYKLWTPLSHCWVLFCHFQSFWAVTPYVLSCWISGLFVLLWPFAACPFDPVCLLDTLLCLPPAPTFALSWFRYLPCLRYSSYCYWTLPVWPPLCVHKACAWISTSLTPLITNKCTFKGIKYTFTKGDPTLLMLTRVF